MIVSKKEYKELNEWLDETIEDNKNKISVTKCGRCGREILKIISIKYGIEKYGMYQLYLCDDCFDDFLDFLDD